jgi:hypothetical protein
MIMFWWFTSGFVSGWVEGRGAWLMNESAGAGTCVQLASPFGPFQYQYLKAQRLGGRQRYGENVQLPNL